jgi:hypothetical protein
VQLGPEMWVSSVIGHIARRLTSACLNLCLGCCGAPRVRVSAVLAPVLAPTWPYPVWQ